MSNLSLVTIVLALRRSISQYCLRYTGCRIASYCQALHLDPDNVLAHFNLGNSLDDQRKREEAISELQQAIALEPKNALFLKNLDIITSKKKAF